MTYTIDITYQVFFENETEDWYEFGTREMQINTDDLAMVTTLAIQKLHDSHKHLRSYDYISEWERTIKDHLGRVVSSTVEEVVI